VKRVASWSKDGKQLVIHDVNKFADDVMPNYFKHGNYSSFVRQLNIYGFHKNVGNSLSNCYSHPRFQRGKKDLIRSIKRKCSTDPYPISNPDSDGNPNPNSNPIPEERPRSPDISMLGKRARSSFTRLEQRLSRIERLAREYGDMQIPYAALK
jgi:hypothetical protein